MGNNSKRNIFAKLKIFGVAFVLILSMVAVACDVMVTRDSEAPATSSERAPETLRLRLGEGASNDNLSVTVIDVDLARRYLWGDEYYEDATQGRAFVIADVMIENIGSRSQFVSGFSFKGEDQDNFAYNTETYLADDRLSSINLLPNQRVRGKLAFEVPDSITRFTIHYDFGDIFSGPSLASWSFTIGASN